MTTEEEQLERALNKERRTLDRQELLRRLWKLKRGRQSEGQDADATTIGTQTAGKTSSGDRED